MRCNKTLGFTLLEILIALFIFTIVSMMLMTALHHVINLQSGTEANAQRLRQVQLALLLVSRDIEQAVNRPILNASGKEEGAFVGEPTAFTLTHMGFANPTGVGARSNLQRTSYQWKDNNLQRVTWTALDLAPATKMYTRKLLSDVTELHVEYLEPSGGFRNQWPVKGEQQAGLPKAVKITMTIANWGTISQLYVLPVKPVQTKSMPEKSENAS